MIMSLTIIGSGNVAWHLAHRLFLAGFHIDQIYGRNANDKSYFADIPNTQFISDIKELNDCEPLYILCIDDDEIPNIISQWPFELDDSQIIAHTSGTTPAQILSPLSPRFGCIWPVQSLNRGKKLVTNQLPLIVSASDDQTAYTLLTIANRISDTVTLLDDTQKKQLHLAAVLTNNFSNHLFTLAAEYCDKNSLDFDLLKPIIKESIMKLDHAEPVNLQTGPARRNDKLTIENQLVLLENEPELYKIYCMMTDSILKRYAKHNK